MWFSEHDDNVIIQQFISDYQLPSIENIKTVEQILKKQYKYFEYYSEFVLVDYSICIKIYNNLNNQERLIDYAKQIYNNGRPYIDKFKNVELYFNVMKHLCQLYGNYPIINYRIEFITMKIFQLPLKHLKY